MLITYMSTDGHFAKLFVIFPRKKGVLMKDPLPCIAYLKRSHFSETRLFLKKLKFTDIFF